MSKELLKKVIFFFAEKIPFNLVKISFNRNPLIPYYHVVCDEKLPHICNLYNYKNTKQFIDDVDFIARTFEPVSLTDLIDIFRQGREPKKNIFLLTFDDGYKEMYFIVAPILKRKGMPAVFFINTDFIDNKELSYKNKVSLIINFLAKDKKLLKKIVSSFPIFSDMTQREVFGKLLTVEYNKRFFLDQLAEAAEIDFNDFLKTYQPYLNRSQIKSMIDNGFSFGAHSKDHPNYSELSLEEQVSQTLDSLRIIKEEFNLSYSVFAFPFGVEGNEKQLFLRISKEVDLTFSTDKFNGNKISWNLNRINFEKSLLPAKTILAHYAARTIFHRLYKN